MNKEDTLSCDRLLNVMDDMGFIPMELDKKHVVFADKDKNPRLTVPLQSGRCHKKTLMNCYSQLSEAAKQIIPFEEFRNHCLGHDVDVRKGQPEKVQKVVPPLPKQIAYQTINYNDLRTFFKENNWNLVGQRGSHFNYAPDIDGFRGVFAITQHGSRKPNMPIRHFKQVMTRLMKANRNSVAQDEIIRLQNALVDKHRL